MESAFEHDELRIALALGPAMQGSSLGDSPSETVPDTPGTEDMETFVHRP